MIFSVVNKESQNRRKLTNLLLSIYPGCVVYELEELLDVSPWLRAHQADAVIWELNENDSQEMSHLNKIKAIYPETVFLICAEDDTLLEEAMWNGASMYFMKPVLPEQLRSALETTKKV